MARTHDFSGNIDQFLHDFMEREKLPASFLETSANIYEPIAHTIYCHWQRNLTPMLVGLCGPQGSGKSTSANVLQALLGSLGLRSAVLSIDDIYLTHRERQKLAKTIHPLLATRGPPGTHDQALGQQIIDAILKGESATLPRFDKSRDDRISDDKICVAPLNTDILLFEGWCVGALPQSDHALEEPVNALERFEDPHGVWRRYVNESLHRYQSLFSQLTMLIQLRPPSFETVFQWRYEQEDKLRQFPGASADGVMNAKQIEHFVAHYERLTRHIITEMPTRADIVIDLDEDRQLTGLHLG